MNSTSRPSLLGRAVVALLLTIGFYALALGIAFFLLYLVYAEIFVVEVINLRLIAGELIGAGVILWAIFPRIDNFTPPGPKLTRPMFSTSRSSVMPCDGISRESASSPVSRSSTPTA